MNDQAGATEQARKCFAIAKATVEAVLTAPADQLVAPVPPRAQRMLRALAAVAEANETVCKRLPTHARLLATLAARANQGPRRGAKASFKFELDACFPTIELPALSR